MRTRWVLSLCVVLTLILAGVSFRAHADPGTGYEIIVNASNTVDSVDRAFVADVFLKKITVWPSGEMANPVDLGSGSSVRRRFSEDVLKRSVEAVKNYWQQRIFAGQEVPPPELETDKDVVSYVSKHPGALGYVSDGVELHDAKAVPLR